MKIKLCLLSCAALLLTLASCDGFFNTNPTAVKENNENNDKTPGEDNTKENNEDETHDENPSGNNHDDPNSDGEDNPGGENEGEGPNINPEEPPHDDKDDAETFTFEFNSSSITENAHLSDTRVNETLVNELNQAANKENFVTSIVADSVDMAVKPCIISEKTKALKISGRSSTGSMQFNFGITPKSISVNAQLYFNHWTTNGGGTNVDPAAKLYVGDVSADLPYVSSTDMTDQTESINITYSLKDNENSISIYMNEIGSRAYVNSITFEF